MKPIYSDYAMPWYLPTMPPLDRIAEDELRELCGRDLGMDAIIEASFDVVKRLVLRLEPSSC